MFPFIVVYSNRVFPAHDNHLPCFIQGSDSRQGQEIKVMREHIGFLKEQETLLDVLAEDITGISVGALGIELLLEQRGDGVLVGMNPG